MRIKIMDIRKREACYNQPEMQSQIFFFSLFSPTDMIAIALLPVPVQHCFLSLL